MKLTGLSLVLSAVALHADVLTETSSFLRSGNPSYSAEGLDGSAGVVDGAYAPFSPADSDLGVQQILQPTPNVTPIHLSLGVDLQYTDNAPAAVGVDHEGSALLTTVLGLSWKPHIQHGWFADLGLSQDYYEFEDGGALDFENGLYYAGLVKNLVDLDDTIFFARLEHQRITTGKLTDSDYFANRIRTGLQKSLYATPRSELKGGISAAFDLSGGPDALERDEYALELTYNHSLTHKLIATASARTAIWNFDTGGRDDSLHILGLGLSYNLNANSTISTGVYYTHNDSNTPGGLNDYESWQGGVSIGYSHSF
ncbi:MAG: outer membrane beta-barrel protein [Akkermansiaceae bacterium]|nr:outer membrane beta-barrel protein [Akkermansiaceae bacterium]